jgi:hypothetical protein
MAQETRYIVTTSFSYMPGKNELCVIDDRGILWVAQTARKSKYRNPTVFNTKKECEKAINSSKKYATKMGYKWATNTYKIIPVTVNI